ncbi:MAG: methyltransferase domain-containing protein [Synergistetes bacterium]|nr:MAG: Methyltransferase type 11 [bacterium 42_11]MBC7332635.1 methyltransferase domain-containing protein [Synergistota bacterium]
MEKKHEKQRKVLGPVDDLEEHVHPDWWRRIFNSMYLKTDADVVEDKGITKAEVDLFIEVLKLSQNERILDLCCGQGRHSLELARRGFKNVEGLDRSHYLIQKAKSRAKREGLNVKFREGDARKLPYQADSFDVVMLLGNSFGYFETVQDDIRVLKEVFRVLKPQGRILIDVADGEYLRNNFQARSWEWIDRKHFVCRERSLSWDKQRLISREVVTHVERGVIADQFYAERLYTRESLKEILSAAGFSDITIHGEVRSMSQRNQDLGMMERRIIITAVAKKEWTPVRRRRKERIPVVAVLLGDPRKVDPLKPSGVFDDDDIYTINKMKEALRELSDYNFIYLDNHNTLIHDLLKLKGKIDFVFNLCDEGFNNDPRKELHIPALLEMLDIPYTGAGPQCLAYCYDKSLVRGVAKEMGIPVPEAFFIKPEDTSFELPFSFPVIVKPNFGDSSFGITQRSVANDVEGLINAILEIREKFGYDKPILVEEFLTGSDLSVGIIGNPPGSYMVLPITEEDYSVLPPGLPPICGYEAKWLPESPYWNIKSVPANLPEETEKFIIECCLKLFERLEARDYCRFDWRLDARGVPRLLEVNPNPGWCWDGHLAKMAKFAGLSYSGMLKAILEAAERRLGLRSLNGEVLRETA